MDYSDLLKRARGALPKEALKERERFEIPRLDSTIVGNRTFVKNLVDVAQVLRREPDHLMKWMAKELASAGQIEGKGAIFQGKFTPQAIGAKFQQYLDTYILCGECGKPDTRLIKEERLLILKCEACGAKRSVPKIK